MPWAMNSRRSTSWGVLKDFSLLRRAHVHGVDEMLPKQPRHKNNTINNMQNMQKNKQNMQKNMQNMQNNMQNNMKNNIQKEYAKYAHTLFSYAKTAKYAEKFAEYAK
jgi:hypothetical protein